MEEKTIDRPTEFNRQRLIEAAGGVKYRVLYSYLKKCPDEASCLVALDELKRNCPELFSTNESIHKGSK